MTKNVSLWVGQALLAALFLFAGGMKLVMPAEALAAQSPLPVAFMRFIGTAEVLGAIGLILPGALRIGTFLTPVAAAGLAVIMCGAVAVTVLGGQAAVAAVPAVIGVIAVSVAYGRGRSTAAAHC